jgi:hypothetical protein
VTGIITREIAGWLLLVLGLLAFRETWLMLTPRPESQQHPLIFEAWPVAFIGFFIFRGGIHLLKVAVAARAAQRANRELEEAARRPRLPLPRAASLRK